MMNFENYKHKEVIGNATLYQGDCLGILSGFGTKEVDAVVTDPPYGVKAFQEGWGPTRFKFNGYNKKKVHWDKRPSPRYFTQIFRMSQYQIIWGGNYFDFKGSPNFLIWDKVQPEEVNFSQVEMAWTNLESPAKLFRYSIKRYKRVHITEKPLPLMVWCIERLSLKPDSLIVDPFMGSGTTGCAAHNLGHRFIGVEKEPDYFDMACKRIEQAQRQLRLFEAV